MSPSTIDARQERCRILSILEVDPGSSISPRAAAAVAAGTAARDYAASIQRETVTAPNRGPSTNRGVAAVRRLRGKVPGLPAEA